MNHIRFKDFTPRISLNNKDVDRLSKLVNFEMQWTNSEQLLSVLGFNDESGLVSWLRKQSSNRIDQHKGKPIHKLTVLKSYSHDPVTKKTFVALCPLFTGREYLWWD